MDNRITLLASWVGTALFAGTASAGIIGTTGAILEIPPPPPGSVVLGALESNRVVFAFAEMLGIEVNDIEVDITLWGPVNNVDDLTPGVLSPQTPVDVFFLHADPPGNQQTRYQGTITFDQDILGIIILDASLNATDGTLGFPGTAYPTGLLDRGLDLAPDFPVPDFITLSVNLRTITIDWGVSTATDQIRIITAVPGPGGLALLAGAGLLGIRRRRR